MKKLMIISLALLMASCSSLPKGEPVLSQMVEEDQGKISSSPTSNPYQGRPIFVRITAYPQPMPQGDIFVGGELLISIGRENLSLEELL